MRHMKTRIAAVLAAGMLLGMTACSGSDSEESVGPEEPTTATVTVELHDQAPQELLYNGDGGVCTSQNFAELLTGGQSAPVEVTVRSADGTVVGTQELPETGGAFTQGQGCTWEVEFADVEASDFYEATVSGGGGLTQSQTAERDGESARVVVEF